MRTYHDNSIVTSLPDNYIFVFGSNRAGRHGKGAALTAKRKFGAIEGTGYGLQGKSFGIPTKDRRLSVLPLSAISSYCSKLIALAKETPDVIYFVTEIGCGLAGYSPKDIAPLFKGAPDNLELPISFHNHLEKLE